MTFRSEPQFAGVQNGRPCLGKLQSVWLSRRQLLSIGDIATLGFFMSVLGVTVLRSSCFTS